MSDRAQRGSSLPLLAAAVRGIPDLTDMGWIPVSGGSVYAGATALLLASLTQHNAQRHSSSSGVRGAARSRRWASVASVVRSVCLTVRRARWKTSRRGEEEEKGEDWRCGGPFDRGRSDLPPVQQQAQHMIHASAGGSWRVDVRHASLPCDSAAVDRLCAVIRLCARCCTRRCPCASIPVLLRRLCPHRGLPVLPPSEPNCSPRLSQSSQAQARGLTMSSSQPTQPVRPSRPAKLGQRQQAKHRGACATGSGACNGSQAIALSHCCVLAWVRCCR